MITNENVISLRLVVAGQDVRTVRMVEGTTLGQLLQNHTDRDGRTLSPSSGQFFVNGASINEDYEFVDDNQMLIVVGAVYNG